MIKGHQFPHVVHGAIWLGDQGTMHVCCQEPEQNTLDLRQLGVRTPVQPGHRRRWGRPESFQDSVVAADPRLDDAELVTMVGCSGPSFTDEGLPARLQEKTMWLQKRDCTFPGPLLEVAVAKHLDADVYR